MRRVEIIKKPGETYGYAAVDLETGDIPLRLTDLATLIGLCRRLGSGAPARSRIKYRGFAATNGWAPPHTAPQG